MDSGNDSLDNIKVCREERSHYIIKHNLRRETAEEWLEIAKECGELEEPARQAGMDWGTVYKKAKN